MTYRIAFLLLLFATLVLAGCSSSAPAGAAAPPAALQPQEAPVAASIQPTPAAVQPPPQPAEAAPARVAAPVEEAAQRTLAAPAPRATLARRSADASDFRIQIPDAGVDAPMVGIGLEADGSMAAPDGPDIVGWFTPGARPGEPGNVLLDGHVDWADRQTGAARTAVFWNLKDAGEGSAIIIDADGRRHTYTVRETLRFEWDDPSALRVLQPTAESLVTLITCEGVFDAAGHNYSHRRVVIAALISSE